MRRTLIGASMALVALAAGARPAAAQAWVPRAGFGSVTFVTQMIDHYGRLIDGSGARFKCCGATNVAVDVEVDYGLTDRWSVSADLPFVFAKYRGEAFPPPADFLPYLPVDACHCVHGAVQDVGFSTRYNLIRRRSFALTPSVSVEIPSHNYDYVGEATIGFHLTQVGIGASAGQRLDAVLRGLSVEERYTYTIVERVLGIAHNRSNALLDGGYAVTRHLSGHALLYWQKTHGGLHFPADVQPFPDRWSEFHRLLQDNYLQTGGALSYSWKRWDITASVLRAARGTNSHEVRVYSISLARAFRARR